MTRTAQNVAYALGLVACATILVIFIVDEAWITDDALITFRYAQNAVSGNGLVFNPGERVEAFTSPLFVMLLVVPAALGANLFFFAQFLGVLFTLAEFCGVVVLLRRYGRSSLAALLAVIWFSTDRIVYVWATGGLETATYSALLFGCFGVTCATLLRPRSGRLIVAASIGYVLLVLARPDGLAFYPIYLAALAWHGRPDSDWWRPVVRSLLITGSLLALFVALRLAYYGALLPNTYAAKVSGVPRAGFGWGYLVAFGDRLGLTGAHAVAWLAVAACFAVTMYVRARRARAAGTKEHAVYPLVVVAGTGAAYLVTGASVVVYMGGDYMTDFRFMRPLMGILFVVVAAVCVFSVRNQTHRAGRVIAWLAVLALTVSHGMRQRAPAAVFADAPEPHQHKRNLSVDALRAARFRAAVFLIARPGDSLLTDWTGYKGYGHTLRTVDATGLTSRHVARDFYLRPLWNEWKNRERLPGHARWPRVEFMLRERFTFIFPKLSKRGHQQPEIHRRSPKRHKRYPFLHVTLAVGDGNYLRFFTTLAADELSRRARVRDLDLCWRIPRGKLTCARDEPEPDEPRQAHPAPPALEARAQRTPHSPEQAAAQFFGAMAAADCGWLANVTAGKRRLLDSRLTCDQLERSLRRSAPIRLLRAALAPLSKRQEQQRLVHVTYRMDGRSHSKFLEVTEVAGVWKVTDF